MQYTPYLPRRIKPLIPERQQHNLVYYYFILIIEAFS